jgi:hypothetical protein
LVHDFVKKYPQTTVEHLPEATKVKYYSPKQLSIWLSTFRKDWSEDWHFDIKRVLITENI